MAGDGARQVLRTRDWRSTDRLCSQCGSDAKNSVRTWCIWIESGRHGGGAGSGVRATDAVHNGNVAGEAAALGNSVRVTNALYTWE